MLLMALITPSTVSGNDDKGQTVAGKSYSLTTGT